MKTRGLPVLIAAVLAGAAGGVSAEESAPPAVMRRAPEGSEFRYDPKAGAAVNEARRARLQRGVAELAQKLKRFDRQRRSASLAESTPASGSPITAEREALALELESWKAVMRRFELESICGPHDDSVDVEKYAGTLPPKAFVDRHQGPVVQIEWRPNLAGLLGPQVDPGNVSGEKWCTGTMVAPNLMLTAGHCFDPVRGPEWFTPRKNGVSLSAQELAPLMQATLGYQVSAATGAVKPGVSFPITALREYRLGKLDYAVVQVGRNAAGELPDTKFGVAKTDSSQAALDGAHLVTVIQHPWGRPKRVEAGVGLSVAAPHLFYSDVDTEGGASGSGVLDQRGMVIAVHIAGGCFETGGANQSVTLPAIRKVSKVIQELSAP